MSSQRVASLIGAFVFLALAACALYRLMFGHPMEIGGMHVGQTMSFFALVAFAAISLILFRGARGTD
jgi:hypothetical protein